MVTGRTIVHGIVGALVGIVFSFVPFSTALGGAVAGFLEGPDSRAGTVAGVVAGAITFVPIAALTVGIVVLVGIGTSATAVPLEGFAVVLLLFAIGSSLAVLYTVGFAALGGFAGAALARRYPGTRRRVRRTIGVDERRAPRSRRTGVDRRRGRQPHDRSDHSVSREPVTERPGPPVREAESSRETNDT